MFPAGSAHYDPVRPVSPADPARAARSGGLDSPTSSAISSRQSVIGLSAMSEIQVSARSAQLSAPQLGAAILDRARELAQWTELPEGLMCTYFSEAHKAAAAQLHDWMTAAG